MMFVSELYWFYRSKGRIVEAIIDDFVALAGSSPLTVLVQNIGRITADFSVSCPHR